MGTQMSAVDLVVSILRDVGGDRGVKIRGAQEGAAFNDRRDRVTVEIVDSEELLLAGEVRVEEALVGADLCCGGDGEREQD